MKTSFWCRTSLIAGLSAVLFWSAAGFAQTDGSTITSNKKLTMEQRLELGTRDFRTYCASCHGASGVGDGPVAAEFVKKPIDLTEMAKNSDGVFSAEKIQNIVDGRDMPRAHGTSDMPVWGVWFSAAANAAGLLQDDISTTEAVVQARIERLTDYLKTIQK